MTATPSRRGDGGTPAVLCQLSSVAVVAVCLLALVSTARSGATSTEESTTVDWTAAWTRRKEVNETNAFAEWVASTAHRVPSNQWIGMTKYAATLSHWARQHAGTARGMPVVYPFSGADVMTAVGLFPQACAYLMIAEFAPGDVTSFVGDTLSDLQASAASTSALGWLGHVHHRAYEYSVTSEMRRYFDQVGVLPSLLLALHLLGVPADSRREGHSKTRLTRVRTTEAACVIDFDFDGQSKRLAYVRAYVNSEAVLKALLNNLPFFAKSTPFSFLFKAGAHQVARMPWFANVVLDTGGTVLQDESGLRVRAFDDANWQVKAFGTFVNFTNSQRDQYPADTSELHRLFDANRRTRRLPFCFGYCEWSDEGTLIVAEKNH